MGPLPGPPRGGGRGWRDGGYRVAEFKRLVMWVGRFRDIRPSRCDDPYYRNVPDGNSVTSVLSVLKKTEGAPLQIIFLADFADDADFWLARWGGLAINAMNTIGWRGEWSECDKRGFRYISVICCSTIKCKLIY